MVVRVRITFDLDVSDDGDGRCLRELGAKALSCPVWNSVVDTSYLKDCEVIPEKSAQRIFGTADRLFKAGRESQSTWQGRGCLINAQTHKDPIRKEAFWRKLSKVEQAHSSSS